MAREKKARRPAKARKPAYRPVPFPIRRTRRRGRIDSYCRFYCMAIDYSGKRIRPTFLVRVPERMSNKEMYYWIVAVCNAINDKTVPEHRPNQVFNGFKELFYGTPWIKVRKIIDYNVDMFYTR